MRTFFLTAALALVIAAPATADTSLVMTSDAGDNIGHGKSFRYVPGGQVRFAVSGNRGRINARVDDGTDAYWELRAAPALGQRLESKRSYRSAKRLAFSGANAGLDVSTTGNGCNTVTGSFRVVSATWLRGRLRTLVLTFEQHCEGKAPALRGTLRYHAGERSAPKPRGGSFAWEALTGVHKDRLVNGQRELEAATNAGDANRMRSLSKGLQREISHFRTGALEFGRSKARSSLLRAIAAERSALKRYDAALRTGDQAALRQALQKVMTFWRFD